MDSLIGDGTCLESQESKKIKTNNLQPEDATGSVTLSPANKLCEDELSLIFRNCCITPKDLLNFRLVNKCWRDTATGTLLKRDACSIHVSLNRTQQNTNEVTVADFPYYRDKLNVGNDEDKKILLTEFVKLAIVMKNSPKFPSSRLCIHSSYSSSTNYHDLLDLSLFFAHHRDRIKTICPHGGVTKKNLHGILFLFTPQLECLDLSEAGLISSDIDDEDDNYSNWDSKLLPFKSLILGRTYNTETSHEITRLLLASPSNLRSIKEVDLIHLPDVLEAGKGHLTSSFTFRYSSDEIYVNHINLVAQSVPGMNLFWKTNPKLSKLKLDLESSDFYFDTLLSLRQIIRSSKDTLKDLTIFLHYFDLGNDPYTLLHIPPMLNLESITLSIGLNYDSNPLDDLRLGLNEGKNLFSFEDQNSGDKYFPSLTKVTFLKHQGSQGSHVEQNIFCFFRKLEDTNGGSTKSNFPRVKTLVLHNCHLPQIYFMSRLSDVFPNIRDLHVKFFVGLINTSDPNSFSLWLQCPSVELIEIYDICIPIDITDDLASIFDAFFTGFSLVMCQKLRQKDLPQVMDNSETLDFLRITPSVCELEYLKELRMKFSSTFSSEFASDVTGIYAFSKMENTKFVVSYNPILWKQNMQSRNHSQDMDYDDDDDEAADEAAADDDDDDEIAAAAADEAAAADDEAPATADEDNKKKDMDIDVLCFGSLKPYVCIVHDTRNF